MRTIKDVLVTEQQGIRIYTFGLSAQTLVGIGKVERFEDGGDGVNRQLNHEHMLEIATAMSSKGANKATSAIWLEPFIVALKGDWKYDPSKRALIGGNEAYFSIDDGQHRFEALRSNLLTDEEISQLNFTVTATLGLTYAQRLLIFRMQAERRPIDVRLDLAQRNKLGMWKKDADQEAYALVLRLNSDEDSPLKGRIQLTEGDGTRNRNALLGNGLYMTIKMLGGRRSPISHHLPAKRAEIVKAMLQSASKIWPKAWGSDKHVLVTGRGINAVLRLLVSGINFRSVVGLDFTPERIEMALEAGRVFDWDARKFKNLSTELIMERLDEAIKKGALGTARRRASETGDSTPPSKSGLKQAEQSAALQSATC